MTFAEQIAEHVGTVFLNGDHFAETITITPPAGSPLTVTAVVEPVISEEEDGPRGREDWREWRVFVAEADWPNPSDRAIVALPAGDCAVSRPPVVEQGMITLYVSRHGSVEISREGYRGPKRRRGPVL